MKKEKSDALIKSLKEQVEAKDKEIAELKGQLTIQQNNFKKLLNKACLDMSEAKRMSRMMGAMEEDMGKLKEQLIASERENRNLKLWMSMKGIRKDI